MWLFKDMHLVAWPLMLGAVLIESGVSVPMPRWAMQVGLWLLHACALMILCYVALAGLRLHFNEWVEHGVVAVARYWERGGGVYPSPDILAKFGVYPYGPLLFQIVGAASFAVGDSNLALKALAAIFAFLVYGWMFWVLRQGGVALGIGALVVEILAVVVGIMGFMVKADVLLIGLATLACGLVSLRPRRVSTGIGLALLAGLATAIKIHGGFYILPAMMVFLAARRVIRTRDIILGVVIAGGVAMLPFVVPRTDLGGYVRVLVVAAHDGLLPGIFISNVFFICSCALGTHALVPAALRDGVYRGLMQSVLVAALIVSVFAAKSEAGPHHLIPFLPYLCLPLGRGLTAEGNYGQRALLLALFLVSFQPISGVWKDFLLMIAHWNAAGALI